MCNIGEENHKNNNIQKNNNTINNKNINNIYNYNKNINSNFNHYNSHEFNPEISKISNDISHINYHYQIKQSLISNINNTKFPKEKEIHLDSNKDDNDNDKDDNNLTHFSMSKKLSSQVFSNDGVSVILKNKLAKLQVAENYFKELCFEMKNSSVDIQAKYLEEADDEPKLLELYTKENKHLFKTLNKMNEILNVVVEASSKVAKKDSKNKIPANDYAKVHGPGHGAFNHNKKKVNPNIANKTHQSNVSSIISNKKYEDVYAKEFNKFETRFIMVSEPGYLEHLESVVSNLNSEISCFEQENKKEMIKQKQSEYVVERQMKQPSSSITDIDALNNECNSIKALNEKFIENVQKNKEKIKQNEDKIKELTDWSGKLELIAKDNYNLNEIDFKNLVVNEKRNMELKIQHEKKIDILNKLLISNAKKYEADIMRNEKKILILSRDKMEALNNYKEKLPIANEKAIIIKNYHEIFGSNVNKADIHHLLNNLEMDISNIYALKPKPSSSQINKRKLNKIIIDDKKEIANAGMTNYRKGASISSHANLDLGGLVGLAGLGLGIHVSNTENKENTLNEVREGKVNIGNKDDLLRKERVPAESNSLKSLKSLKSIKEEVLSEVTKDSTTANNVYIQDHNIAVKIKTSTDSKNNITKEVIKKNSNKLMAEIIKMSSVENNDVTTNLIQDHNSNSIIENEEIKEIKEEINDQKDENKIEVHQKDSSKVIHNKPNFKIKFGQGHSNTNDDKVEKEIHIPEQHAYTNSHTNEKVVVSQINKPVEKTLDDFEEISDKPEKILNNNNKNIENIINNNTENNTETNNNIINIKQNITNDISYNNNNDTNTNINIVNIDKIQARNTEIKADMLKIRLESGNRRRKDILTENKTDNSDFPEFKIPTVSIHKKTNVSKILFLTILIILT